MWYDARLAFPIFMEGKTKTLTYEGSISTYQTTLQKKKTNILELCRFIYLYSPFQMYTFTQRFSYCLKNTFPLEIQSRLWGDGNFIILQKFLSGNWLFQFGNKKKSLMLENTLDGAPLRSPVRSSKLWWQAHQ